MVDKIWYNMEELIGGSEERGINRNILECKGRCSAFSQEIEKVLIETYWNVKLSDKQIEEQLQDVLIETYWNVKDEFKLVVLEPTKY